MKPLPPLLLLTVRVLCIAVGLCAAATAVASLTIAEKPLWLIVGFECVVVVASILGLQFSRGAYRLGQGMALACIAASILIATLLSYLSVQGRFQVRGQDAAVSLKLWLFARVGAAALLGLFGAYAVLIRNPKSWHYLLRSVLTGVPVLLALAGGYVFRGRISGVLSTLSGWTAALAAIIAIIAGLLIVVLISASVHCLIRAFEVGRTDESPATQ